MFFRRKKDDTTNLSRRIDVLESLVVSLARMLKVDPQTLADERTKQVDNLIFVKKMKVRNDEAELYNLENSKKG